MTSHTFWQGILDADGEPPAGHSAEQLLPELLDALASPDPDLRDELAYPLLDTWVHSGRLSPEAMRALTEELTARLLEGIDSPGDDRVFRRTFAALGLAELVGEDNERPFLAEERLRAVFGAALRYLAEERDLRGFVPGKGWAHGVAHVADLLWLLAYSPHLGAADRGRILAGIAARLQAEGEQIFRYSEESRLATAAIGALGRGLPDGMAEAWLDQLTVAGGERLSMASRLDPVGLARYHNLRGFLISLHFQLEHPSESAWPGMAAYLRAQITAPPPAAVALAPHVLGALRAMRGI